jgi:hypothetical protein
MQASGVSQAIVDNKKYLKKIKPDETNAYARYQSYNKSDGNVEKLNARDSAQ